MRTSMIKAMDQISPLWTLEETLSWLRVSEVDEKLKKSTMITVDILVGVGWRGNGYKEKQLP